MYNASIDGIYEIKQGEKFHIIKKASIGIYERIYLAVNGVNSRIC